MTDWVFRFAGRASGLLAVALTQERGLMAFLVRYGDDE